MDARAARRLFASGYTDGSGKSGVCAFDISRDGGSYDLVGKASGVASPSYCTLAGTRLYAASEVPSCGALAAYAVGADGVPVLQDARSFPEAAGTCFVLARADGKRLYGADYESGSVCSCALDRAGELCGPIQVIQHVGRGAQRAAGDPNLGRQDAPHVHTLSFVPGTGTLAAVDLGLDLIAIYRTDSAGRIIDSGSDPVVNPWLAVARKASLFADRPVRPAAVVEAPLYSGPRIVAYHPTLPIAALVCELSCEIILFRIGNGGLSWEPCARWDLLRGLIDLSRIDAAPLAAHCAFSQDGRFLYTTTRSADRLTIFALDDRGDQIGRLDCWCGGRTPRHFALSPDGALLAVANQGSDRIAVFRRDAATGRVEPAASIPFACPSCVVWDEC